MKERSELSTQKFVEAVETHNNLSSLFNELHIDADAKGEENACLKKKVEDMQATLSDREA